MKDLKKYLHDQLVGLGFGFPQKAEYKNDEVWAIVEQLKNASASRASQIAEKEEAEFGNKITDLSKQLEAKMNEVNGFTTKEKELLKQKEEAEALVEKQKARLESFERKERAVKAKELLGGLVFEGAEADVYDLLHKAIQTEEAKFTDEDTIDDKKAVIKPLVDGLIKNKPYLQPGRIVKQDDNKHLFTNKKETQQEEEFSVEGWEPSFDDFSYQ